MATKEIVICDQCEKELGESNSREIEGTIHLGSDAYQMNVWMGDVGVWLVAKGDDAIFCSWPCFMRWVKAFRRDAETQRDEATVL